MFVHCDLEITVFIPTHISISLVSTHYIFVNLNCLVGFKCSIKPRFNHERHNFDNGTLIIFFLHAIDYYFS